VWTQSLTRSTSSFSPAPAPPPQTLPSPLLQLLPPSPSAVTQPQSSARSSSPPPPPLVPPPPLPPGPLPGTAADQAAVPAPLLRVSCTGQQSQKGQNLNATGCDGGIAESGGDRGELSQHDKEAAATACWNQNAGMPLGTAAKAQAASEAPPAGQEVPVRGTQLGGESRMEA
jgi:hypothetical protein